MARAVGANGGVRYTYAPGSGGSRIGGTDLLLKAELTDSSGTVLATTTRSFEPSRDLIASVQNDWLAGGTTTVSKFAYKNDTLGRRTQVIRTGSAFAGDDYSSPPHKDVWGYNSRNELTGSARYNDTTLDGTSNHDATRDYGYVYDPIGNRTEHHFDQGGTASSVDYGANALNQYTNVRFHSGLATGQRLFYDEDGNLSHTKLMADMNCDGSANPFDINIFTAVLANGCGWYAGQYPSCDCLNGDMNGDGSVNTFDIQPFTDAMAGLGGDTAVPMNAFEWDAENRLVAVVPLGNPPPDGVKWVYAYDYMNRRVAKQKFTRNTNNTAWKTTPDEDTRFVYDGWNVIEELDGTQSPPAVIRKYMWGLDLAGQNGDQRPDRQGAVPQAAGGIGGLLAVRDVGGSKNYAYFYDANGNVGQVFDLSDGSAGAQYEYDPYGNRVNEPTVAEFDQPFKFSTNQFDAESGFYNGKERYYAPRLGRWTNHDPIAERGDQIEAEFDASLGGEFNLYWYVKNDPVDLIDPFGEKARVSVDPKNCTITVTLNIGIYGAKASTTLASKIESCIESFWNGHTTKKGCRKCDPGNCKVALEAHVTYYPNANHWPDVPEDNQVKFTGKTDRSWVLAGGSYGHWENNAECATYAHEAGHLMGLPDYYVDNIFGQLFGEPPRSIPLPGHENDLMGTGNQVTQDDIDGILQGKKCPKECCCQPTTKPGAK